MTDNNHPITPPLDLVEQWFLGARAMPAHQWVTDVATQAARWGADMELVACMNYVDNNVSGNRARALREHRRPKPPSLKEQALRLIDSNSSYLDDDAMSIIRRALESLPD